MKVIEFETYTPSADDPRRQEYAGQRTGREVFAELKQRLESLGLLPDEYFLIGREWEKGEDIPKDADMFVTTDYGGSEGIYLDIYLKWMQDGKPVTKSFATGKTLGDTGADLDRMFLISSAITKAFHGDHGQYGRYQTLHPEQNAGDMLVNLTPKEHKLFVAALIEHREKKLKETDGTEQLLRRMVGSITEYMDVVGERPLHILQPLTYENRNSWMAERYLEAGMRIYSGDYDALYTCIKNGAAACAKLILDQGMDFRLFSSWADSHGISGTFPDAMKQLAEHWADHNPEQQAQSTEEQSPTMGGLSL